MMETKFEMPVFDGEASETESEESGHITFYDDSITMDIANKVQCLEVTGEDAESGDEKESTSSASTATVQKLVKEPKKVKVNSKSQSLLNFKLRESNSMFYNDMEDVIKEFLKTNEKSLTDIDQHISKSQIILQAANPSLKNLHSQSNSLKNKLETLLSSNFLSNVKIKE
ncbi:uncharacterized protein LOC123315386 [Coccinella septempunctata]|uniref:uncharacterized protein LOC123315386 n=1 Tax=Coccinella septempunctata TaxID=41139 RepID=UPI001D06C645|nr:uncharacterized protein LOC123315386 [Coccinella septempunctata]